MATYGPSVLVERQLWRLVAQGMTPTDAGPLLGVSGSCARESFRDRGGVNPQLTDPVGGCGRG